jgi:hypothetical protein
MSIHQVVAINSSQYVQDGTGTTVMKLDIIDEQGYTVHLTIFGPHGVGHPIVIREE